MYTNVNGTAALKMPSNYVLMSEEEMTYADGGGITNSTLISTSYVSARICSDIAGVIAGGAVATARILSKKITGAPGYVIDALIGFCAGYFAVAAGRGGLRIDYYEKTYYSAKEGYSWKVYDSTVSFRN